jgi:ribosomal protein S27E
LKNNRKVKIVVDITLPLMSEIKPPFDLKDIKPGTFAYLTRRKLENREGEERGEIFLWRKVEEKESNYIMRCPFCEREQQGRVLLERRPYRVKCSFCGRTINLPKILNKAKQ